MIKDFLKELEWRGLLQDVMPDTKEHLNQQMRSGYIGFDPTSDSLHVGSLVPIIVLKHFQNCGHRPIVVVGGATGMIGDPSGKSNERYLLDETTLEKNIDGVKKQLSKYLDFDADTENAALLVNNYDWIKKWSFIHFMRDIGKHLTVNYMQAKDSVKKRINNKESEGISFTEFSYQLLQGYDFLHLFEQKSCTVQMGGSDQWGNITTGGELIRRKLQCKSFGITSPLITKSDGSKFGKSEGGNIWLDKNKTSVYKFYQYFLNTSDEDAERYIKLFTFLTQEEIEKLTVAHKEAPHQRRLQKKIAELLTVFVHSEKDFENVLRASRILFGKSTEEDLKSLDEATFLSVFEGVPMADISRATIQKGLDVVDAFTDTGFFKSNSEIRRSLKENAISVNKNKVSKDHLITEHQLIADNYVLLQRGKKTYFILKIK